MANNQKIEVKAPAWAGSCNPAQVSGAGSGASPARKETQPHIFRMPYRYDFKTGEIAHPISFCLKCHRIVKPFARRYSGNAVRGEWIFVHEHPLAFVVLEQDSSGRREVSVVGKAPGSLAYLVKDAWVGHGTDIFFVEDAVKEWLHLAREGREEDLLIVEVNGTVELVEAGEW
jgi:hypothetical protein